MAGARGRSSSSAGSRRSPTAVPAIRRYQWWVTKSETATVICVITGRLVSSAGLSAAISLKMFDEHRDDHRDHDDHHDQRQAEDDRRIGHRRAHLPVQGVEPLELVGDPVERIVEPSRVLPGAHDGAVERVEYPRLGLHRLGHRASGLDVLANADDRLLEHLVLGLRLERVKRAQHRHPRTDQGCELAREDGEGAQVDALEALEDVSSFIASRFSEMSRTIRPRWRSCSETTAFEEASISPRAGTPARSTARNANALIARPSPDHAAAAGMRVTGAPPKSRFSSSGTEARCSASERVILPIRTSWARWASIVCIPIAPDVWSAE